MLVMYRELMSVPRIVGVLAGQKRRASLVRTEGNEPSTILRNLFKGTIFANTWHDNYSGYLTFIASWCQMVTTLYLL